MSLLLRKALRHGVNRVQLVVRAVAVIALKDNLAVLSDEQARRVGHVWMRTDRSVSGKATIVQLIPDLK